jgi:hypothetical protein
MKRVLLVFLMACSRETTAYRVDVPPPSGSAPILLPMASALPRSSIDVPPPQRGFHPGQSVEVEWHGDWWPAHILLVSTTFPPTFSIHYDGYDDSWNEEVGLDRIRVPE